MRKLCFLGAALFAVALAPFARAVPPDPSPAAVARTTHARTRFRVGRQAASPGIAGYSPAQIRHAYGFDQLSADGTGQIVAVIESFGSPTLASDLQTFSTQFSLPAAALTVAYTAGSPPPTGDSGWAFETSLDVEWVHAIAPKAEILVVVAPTDTFSDLLAAVAYANAYSDGSGRTVHQVSMSWGGSEFAGETFYDATFQTAGVSYFASSGDQGSGASYPATSPYVLAVGGTSLTLDSSNKITSEVGWTDSGGGPSSNESEPAFQESVQTSGVRETPDVSYSADPNTGFAVYDSTPYQGRSGWLEAGGTSAGAPQWAALVALVNEQRTTPLSGTSSAVYTLSGASAGTYLRDILSGNNGSFTAKAGYDQVTGLGSPLAATLIPALVGAHATFSATVTSATDSGNGSLRAALAEARAGDTVTVTFDPSLAGQTIVLTATDGAATGATPAAPFGSSALVIDGVTATLDASAAPGLTISGGGTQRIFAVTGGPSAAGSATGSPASVTGSLTLVNVTLSGGHAHGWDGARGTQSGGGGSAGLGGCVYVDRGSALTLVGCLVTGSTAQGGSGVAGGAVAASGGGGGLGADGFGSEGGGPNDPAGSAAGFGGGGTSGSGGGAGGFGGGGASSDGVSTPGGAGGFGGGGGGGDVLDAAGVAGYGAGAGSVTGAGGGGAGLGGGVFVDGGSLTATNCTFAGCRALAGTSPGSAGSGLGGAIFQRNGTIALTFCTLAGNTATTDGGALLVLGDGATATTAVQSSILATSVSAASDVAGATIHAGGALAVTGDHDVVMAQTGLALATVSTADPRLGPLEPNGGPTSSLVLYSGSPAHDAGDATLAAKSLVAGGAAGVDQRGLPRRAVTDVGSSESQPNAFSATSGGGQSTAVLTAFAAIALQVTDPNGDPLRGAKLTLAGPLTGARATLAPSTLTADASGDATVNATANAVAGAYSVAAVGSVSGSFALTNDAGPAAQVGVAGSGQSATVGSPFSAAVSFFVSDAHGNGVGGVALTLTPPSSGASATFSPASPTTDSTGHVSVTATANATSGGPYTVSVVAGSLATTFQLTNEAASSGGGGGGGSGGGGSGSTPTPSPSPVPSPSPTPAASPSPVPTSGNSGEGTSQTSGGGGGGGGGGGCELAPTPGSPASLAPLVLALFGLVLRRTRSSRTRKPPSLSTRERRES